MLSEIIQSEKDQFHSYVESDEQNKLTKYKQTHRYKEQTDSCQRGGALRGWGGKVKG